MDDSCRAFAIDINTSAHQLRDIVVEKIGLKEDGCFALFEKRDDWERCLEPDERPADLMDQWEKFDTKKKGDKDKEDCKFIFKKKIFLKDDDREMEDPVAKDLVYKQAVYNVINSYYPATVEEAVKLACYQFQIVYGNYNPDIHVTGFLTQNNQLKNFVPKQLYSQKKASEWESLILKQLQSMPKSNPEDCKAFYLDIVKQWSYYGTTFYPPCKALNRGLGKVIIGVNYEGIRLLKPKNKELISEHLFTEICSWASSSGTFAFEFGNQNESQKYTFDTKHGVIIASTIQTYIDILVQMLKNGDDDEEESETGTSQSSDGER